MIVSDGCALEILPKIDTLGEGQSQAIGSIRRHLIHMLAVVLDLKIDAGQITKLDWQRETLLEILIRLFSQKLADAVRRGMPRRYVEQGGDLPALRGRLNATRQFTTLAAEPSRLACRYDALTSDIALNRIMKAAVTQLTRITRKAVNQRRLRELAFTYSRHHRSHGGGAPMARSDFKPYQRTVARIANLAQLLLGERFQTTSAGSNDGFSLLFEMHTLFEEYVARIFKRALAETDLNVISQGGRVYCLETADRRGIFQTRPDILIKRGNTVVQVIDTKWKRIGTRIEDPKHGVSQGDIYQMLAYGQLYQCPRLTLLYPHIRLLATKTGRSANIG